MICLKDKKLKKWLEGTNWPEGFGYTHKVENPIVSGHMRILNKLTIFRGISRLEYYINTKVLSKSDFEHVVKTSIETINRDYDRLFANNKEAKEAWENA